MFKNRFKDDFNNIQEESLREEEKEHKKSENVTMVVATKRIYVEFVRKLLRKYNSSRGQEEQVSLSAFYNLKPFYCLKPSEKEKKSCLCIYCLNPHIILKSIIFFRTKNNLKPHESLTTYLNEMSKGRSKRCTRISHVTTTNTHVSLKATSGSKETKLNTHGQQESIWSNHCQQFLRSCVQWVTSTWSIELT